MAVGGVCWWVSKHMSQIANARFSALDSQGTAEPTGALWDWSAVSSITHWGHLCRPWKGETLFRMAVPSEDAPGKEGPAPMIFAWIPHPLFAVWVLGFVLIANCLCSCFQGEMVPSLSQKQLQSIGSRLWQSLSLSQWTGMAGGSILTTTLQGEESSWDVFLSS